jgi:hypothetical protein
MSAYRDRATDSKQTIIPSLLAVVLPESEIAKKLKRSPPDSRQLI